MKTYAIPNTYLNLAKTVGLKLSANTEHFGVDVELQGYSPALYKYIQGILKSGKYLYISPKKLSADDYKDSYILMRKLWRSAGATDAELSALDKKVKAMLKKAYGAKPKSQSKPLPKVAETVADFYDIFK